MLKQISMGGVLVVGDDLLQFLESIVITDLGKDSIASDESTLHLGRISWNVGISNEGHRLEKELG